MSERKLLIGCYADNLDFTYDDSLHDPETQFYLHKLPDRYYERDEKLKIYLNFETQTGLRPFTK